MQIDSLIEGHLSRRVFLVPLLAAALSVWVSVVSAQVAPEELDAPVLESSLLTPQTTGETTTTLSLGADPGVEDLPTLDTIPSASNESGSLRTADSDTSAGQSGTATGESVASPTPDWDLPVRLDASVSIRKIYEFLNDPEITKSGKDKSLEYEFKYFNHGAITKAQRYHREGQYYVVTWTSKGPPADTVLRLDYRQAKTRDLTKTVVIPYPQASGTYKGVLSVVGRDYHEDGALLSWRISIVRNGVIVAEKKSFVW